MESSAMGTGSPEGVETQVDDADTLEAGYTQAHRFYEWIGLALAASSLGMAAYQALGYLDAGVLLWLIAAFAGAAFADLLSGLVHWGFDTWGSVDTPIVGQLAIRTFRHHHLDPKAMVHHDFVETNGHNAMLSVAITAPAALVPETIGAGPTVFLFWAGLLVAFTSQLHKWAHMERPPRVARWLQRARLILPADAHRGHHTAPHDGGYCVTTGWLNGLLDGVGFFRGLERMVTAVTGVLPAERERR